MDCWSVHNLSADAVAVSVSRRTDVPAFYAEWFENRLRDRIVEYIPPRPPRRVRRPLRLDTVLYFNLWSKDPRRFLPALDRVCAKGYPVLWNVTITGLGGTAVEPNVPPPDQIVACVRELSTMVPAAAIQWRYDPVFLSETYDADHHARVFQRLAGELAGYVDRVSASFVICYGRRVAPDLKRYQRENGDRVTQPSLSAQVDIVGRLHDLAEAAGLPFTLCCCPDLRARTGYPASGCNSFDWAARVYPVLAEIRRPKDQATREDCHCSAEIDIGCYDTCCHGCRYSYGSCSQAKARANFSKHDPTAPCIIP